MLRRIIIILVIVALGFVVFHFLNPDGAQGVINKIVNVFDREKKEMIVGEKTMKEEGEQILESIIDVLENFDETTQDIQQMSGNKILSGNNDMSTIEPKQPVEDTRDEELIEVLKEIPQEDTIQTININSGEIKDNSASIITNTTTTTTTTTMTATSTTTEVNGENIKTVADTDTNTEILNDKNNGERENNNFTPQDLEDIKALLENVVE